MLQESWNSCATGVLSPFGLLQHHPVCAGWRICWKGAVQFEGHPGSIPYLCSSPPLSFMKTLKERLRKIPVGRLYLREILSVFFVLVGFYFFRKERGELSQVSQVLGSVHLSWIAVGLVLAGVYMALQALMYITSFRAVNARITFLSALELYLKRNLVGIFLPAGGVTSQTFFRSIAERQGVSNTKTNFASYIFVVLGIASVLVVGIPVILYLVLSTGHLGQEFYYFVILLVVVSGLIVVSRSVYRKGWAHRLIVRFMPQVEVLINDVLSETISGKQLLLTLGISVLIEFCGIAQLYVAMRGLSPNISLQAAFLGYTVATIFLVISPFLKGIGAIELSLVYILTLYGYGTTAAASITLLYRFFNFWLLVLAGLLVFLFSRQNLLLRIFPSFLIFILGLVNLMSGLSPAIHWRMRLIEEYLPLGTVHFSNDLIIASGVVLLVCSAFLLRGLRNAWVMALAVSLLSVVAHITKAIDYEEALFAALVCSILIATRKQYQVKGIRRLMNVGVVVAVGIFVTGLLFGFVGFYFLDKQQFGVDLNRWQSLHETLRTFFLLNTDLVPKTRFAHGFLRAINVLGISSFGFLLYAFLRPFVYDRTEEQDVFDTAKALVERYGTSSAEYFKTYPDKLLFFTQLPEGFVSYKVAHDFAIALGTPVCENRPEVMAQILDQFERYCAEHGLRTIYYRVNEESLSLFANRNMRALPIGQEAIVDVQTFNMDGKRRQNLRTARNNLLKKGYQCRVLEPPVPGNILQQLKAVSDDWLEKLNEQELVFSQGMFLEEELRQHTLLILEAPDGKIVAFVDVVPDYKPGEARYDLIRRVSDEYSGCLDMLMVELIFYLKARGFQHLNMGMAPMSGIETPKGLTERSIKFAYERIKRFSHYRGLRYFKEKFDPVWTNKYLIYAHHFDLLLIPGALDKVMKDV